MAMMTLAAIWSHSMAATPAWPADFIGLGASLVTMFVVTPLTQRFDPPRPLVDVDGNPVDLNDRLGTLGSERKARPVSS